MSTLSRSRRFNQEKLQSIINSGSVNYTFMDNLLSINVNSDDPNTSLVSIPLNTPSFSVQSANSIFTTQFEEFVKIAPETVPTQVIDIATVEALQSQLNKLIVDAEAVSEQQGLMLAMKDVIIKLRIQLDQGYSAQDFSDTFPFLPNK